MKFWKLYWLKFKGSCFFEDETNHHFIGAIVRYSKIWAIQLSSHAISHLQNVKKNSTRNSNYSSSVVQIYSPSTSHWDPGANLFQTPRPKKTFQMLQSNPTWPPPMFEPCRSQPNHFSKILIFFTPTKKPTKNKQMQCEVWARAMFWLGFSVVSGVPRSTWMLDSEKVFKGYCRSLQAPPESTGVVWNHVFFFLWRLGWFGSFFEKSRKFGVEIVKTKTRWLSHVLTWKKKKWSFKA